MALSQVPCPEVAFSGKVSAYLVNKFETANYCDCCEDWFQITTGRVRSWIVFEPENACKPTKRIKFQY